MDRNELEGKVLDMLEDICADEAVREERDIDLFDAGLLDSLAAIEVLVGIEENFGVEIAPTAVERKEMNTVNKIIEQTGVKIDIEDDGSVSVCGTDQAMIDKAVSIIKGIVTDIEPGQILTGTVVRIMNFGAFVELAPNKDGMVHISKLSDKRVAKVEDVVNIGDEVTVKVIEVDKMGRINLSIKPGDLAENK